MSETRVPCYLKLEDGRIVRLPKRFHRARRVRYLGLGYLMAHILLVNVGSGCFS
jgi:hypothetical protein